MSSIPLGSRNGLPVAEVVQTLLFRIAIGELPAGSQLPTCRSLADELNVSRSTVNRAYHEIEALGVVRNEGKGAVVLPQGKVMQRTEALGQFRAELASMVRRALLFGLARAEIEAEFQAALDEAERTSDLRMGFIECSLQDARAIASHLQTQIADLKVVPLHLDDLKQQPDWWRSYDLLTTTFYHLAEVEELLPAEERGKLTGLQHWPGSGSVLQIARLPRRSRVVIVAKNERTRDRLEHFVRMYGPDNVESCLTTQRDRLADLLATAEAVVTTHSCLEIITGMAPAVNLIDMDFQIRSESVAELVNRAATLLAERQRRGLA